MKTNHKNTQIFTFFLLAAAVVLWYSLFVLKLFNFWLQMSISIFILVFASLMWERKSACLKKIKVNKRHVIIGVLSAVLLYFIFYIGNIISGLIFPFKDSQILSIYSNRSENSLLLIGLLLFFFIGPGEEIFWRGFIQKNFSWRYGNNKGFLITSLIYGGIHIVTGNTMLVIAALICGFYWGWIYKREKSLVPVIISHSIWDVLVFVLFPFI